MHTFLNRIEVAASNFNAFKLRTNYNNAELWVKKWRALNILYMVYKKKTKPFQIQINS